MVGNRLSIVKITKTKESVFTEIVVVLLINL